MVAGRPSVVPVGVRFRGALPERVARSSRRRSVCGVTVVKIGLFFVRQYAPCSFPLPEPEDTLWNDRAGFSVPR